MKLWNVYGRLKGNPQARIEQLDSFEAPDYREALRVAHNRQRKFQPNYIITRVCEDRIGCHSFRYSNP